MENLLIQAYELLEYNKGDLFDLQSQNLPLDRELDIGEWINSCQRINKKLSNFAIDAIFFVKDNPAIIFGTSPIIEDYTIEQAYINIWNLARPQYFFLEMNGELRIYDFSAPIVTLNGKRAIPKPIELIYKANEILEKLQNISRNKIEAGIAKLKSDSKQYRADKTLINDIKKIRIELKKLGLDKDNIKYAHSIIGRSIFIRYLEDRGILTSDYFATLASYNKEWEKVLLSPFDDCVSSYFTANDNYIKCLRNKEFTYALYRKLSQDFNGDMFPIDEIEESIVTAEQLLKISEFLQGKFDEQMRLFFWSYKFDVIPMELMSNLYEEFYHTQTENDSNGTHYTPLSLVEFVIKQALPVETLERNPKVLDPCCGSGIFLVESFKRIVRYNIIKNNGVLSYDILKEILRTQIRGVELKDEALRVAAFSLYVAFLDFQEPPCILEQIKKGKYLPNLKHDKNIVSSFNILLCYDAFSDEATNFIGKQKANLVVGNPPWGEADNTAIEWCKTNKLPLGDKQYSQAFIWRAINWVEDNGVICLLIPTNIFANLKSPSQYFKIRWLNQVTIKQIVNFAHSRDVFFKKAIAPFLSVLFVNSTPNNNYVSYWSVKKNSQNIENQYITLGRSDMHFIKQSQLAEYNYAWKTLWWGGLADLSLINKIKLNSTLINAFSPESMLIKQGFTPGKGETESIDRIKDMRCLSLNKIASYGNIQKYLINEPPNELHRNFSSFDVFEGERIIFKKGPSSPRGEFVVRVETEPFCFNNSIHCIRFYNQNIMVPKVIGSILLSSLAKYYFFLTSSVWGMWHFDIRLEELEQFPIPNIEKNERSEKLCLLMDEIKAYEEITIESSANKNQRSYEAIIHDIDKIVFEMYQVTDDEKALIMDMCEYGLDLFYNKTNSIALKELPIISGKLFGIEKNLDLEEHLIYSYIGKIVSSLNKYLIDISAELEWRIYRSKGIIAVLFLTKYLTDPINIDYESKHDWEVALQEFNKLSKQAITDDIYIEGSFVGISENCIAIIKKDEYRNWSAGAAVKDLNSILLKLIDKQSIEVNGNE